MVVPEKNRLKLSNTVVGQLVLSWLQIINNQVKTFVQLLGCLLHLI